MLHTSSGHSISFIIFFFFFLRLLFSCCCGCVAIPASFSLRPALFILPALFLCRRCPVPFDLWWWWTEGWIGLCRSCTPDGLLRFFNFPLASIFLLLKLCCFLFDLLLPGFTLDSCFELFWVPSWPQLWRR